MVTQGRSVFSFLLLNIVFLLLHCIKLSCRAGVEVLIYSKLDCRRFCLGICIGNTTARQEPQNRTVLQNPRLLLLTTTTINFFMSNVYKLSILCAHGNYHMVKVGERLWLRLIKMWKLIAGLWRDVKSGTLLESQTCYMSIYHLDLNNLSFRLATYRAQYCLY